LGWRTVGEVVLILGGFLLVGLLIGLSLAGRP